MNKASQDEMVERRKDMISYHQSGIKVKDWVSIVAKEHNVSEDAIRKDWGKRREWMKHFVSLNETKKLGWKILQDYELTLIDANNLYEQTEDTKTKIQLLWLRVKINKQKFEFITEAGLLEFLKTEVRHKNSSLVEDLMEEKEPGYKERIRKEKEQQKKMDELLSSNPFKF